MSAAKSAALGIAVRTQRLLDARAPAEPLGPAIPNSKRGQLMFRAASLAGITTSGNTPTITYDRSVRPDGQGMDGMVKIVTQVGLQGEAIFSFKGPRAAPTGIGFWLKVEDWSKVSSIIAYVGDAGFANSWFTTYSRTSGINSSARYADERPGYVWIDASQFTVAAGTPTLAGTQVTTVKIRVTPVAGQQATVWVNDIYFDMPQDRAKIAIVHDDGGEAFFTNGLPVMDARGLKGSLALIGDLVDDPGIVTLAQLKAAVANGHECVVHGPIGGAGSLRNYTTEAEITNDIRSHRDFLVNNGLATNGSERIYVYPQGANDLVAGDKVIMNALKSLGFVAARGVQTGVGSLGVTFPATAVGITHAALSLPIIGHNWSATDEATNIANIIAKMDEAIARKSSCILMVHEVVTGTPAHAGQITAADWTALMDAVALRVARGDMECVKMTDLCRYAGLLPQPA